MNLSAIRGWRPNLNVTFDAMSECRWKISILGPVRKEEHTTFELFFLKLHAVFLTQEAGSKIKIFSSKSLIYPPHPQIKILDLIIVQKGLKSCRDIWCLQVDWK